MMRTYLTDGSEFFNVRAIDKHPLEVFSLKRIKVGVDGIIHLEDSNMFDLIARYKDMLLNESIEVYLVLSSGLLCFD